MMLTFPLIKAQKWAVRKELRGNEAAPKPQVLSQVCSPAHDGYFPMWIFFAHSLFSIL